MKNALIPINFIFVVISLSILLADFNYNSNAYSSGQLACKTACNDFSTHADDSQIVCFEDVLFLNDGIGNLNQFSCNILLLWTSNLNFKNNYSLSFWQPPKKA